MAINVIQGVQQTGGQFNEMWLVTNTACDFANAAVGSGTFASVDNAVPGVALGDMVIGVSAGVDTVDAVIWGAVTAANVVTLTLMNNSAGAVDLASTTVKFIVGRPAW
jgi:hypothetical protein